MARLPSRLLTRLEQLTVDAPFPYLRRGRPAASFNLLRQEVLQYAGFDFLAKVDLLRPRNFVSSNPNVGKRSRHICGDSFDFDVNDSRYIIVKESEAGLRYWRVFLRCELAAIGGTFLSLNADLAGKVKGHFLDFTRLAEIHGFSRIPAWQGWSHEGEQSQLRGFWHFEFTEGFTWDEGASFLYGATLIPRAVRQALKDKVVGLNDRMPEVKNLQVQLAKLGYLRREFCNQVFDLETANAVKEFQSLHSLKADGVVGPATRHLLVEKTLTHCSPAFVWPGK